MKALSVNEAKTQFGNLLLSAQREPIQINRNGSPVAVVLSIDDYQNMEALKLKLLQDRAIEAKELPNAEGDTFFQALIAGQYD